VWVGCECVLIVECSVCEVLVEMCCLLGMFDDDFCLILIL